MKENKRSKRRIKRHDAGKIYHRLARIFVVSLGVFFLLNLAWPDKEFSEEENRVLTGFPEFSLDALVSGNYMTEFESYVSDQFFARNQWIALKLFEDKLLGKTESNGVYLGKDGYLMEFPDDPDWDSVEKNMKAISSFAERYPDATATFLLIPNSFYILEDKLPYGAPVRDQQQDIDRITAMAAEQVNMPDMSEILKKHREEEIYYRTDHHWTSLGAFYAFEGVAESLGIDNPETDYDVYTVTEKFQGTLASKSGSHKVSDRIQVYQPKNQTVDYIVNYVEENEKSTSIYVSDAIKEKDKYTVFFGGNHARIDIGTTQPDRRSLLLFKDSYANCFVQFLLPYYQNIIIVDPRYYYDNIDSVMESYGVTDILFLYNVNTFVCDNSIADILTVSEEQAEGE